MYKLTIYIWSKFSKISKLCSIHIFHELAISISNWQRDFFLLVRFIIRLYFDLYIITDYWNHCACRIYIHRRIVSKFQNFISLTVLMNQRFQLKINDDLFFDSLFYYFIILSFYHFIVTSTFHIVFWVEMLLSIKANELMIEMSLKSWKTMTEKKIVIEKIRVFSLKLKQYNMNFYEFYSFRDSVWLKLLTIRL